MEEGGMRLRSGKSKTPIKGTFASSSCSTPKTRKRNAAQTPGSSSKKPRLTKQQTPTRARKINFDEVDENVRETGNVGDVAAENAQPLAEKLQGPESREQDSCSKPEDSDRTPTPGRRINFDEVDKHVRKTGNVGDDLGVAGDKPQEEKLQGSKSREQEAELGSEVPEPDSCIMKAPKQVFDVAQQILRRRLCDFQAAPVLPNLEENKKKLLDLLEHTVVHACNNSSLLLGPRGCGKSMILENVLREMEIKFPGKVRVVRLNGLIHVDDKSAMKEIAKQLCVGEDVEFSKGASFDENLRFLTIVLRKFKNSHKAIVFVLDEFDLFAQRPKQCLLYNLLNVLQSSFSQAAIIGLSCRLDADQLLEKRVRSRFSQRKLLFLPSPAEEIIRLLELVLKLPVDARAPYAQFATSWNARTMTILHQESTKQFIKQLTDVEVSPRYIVDIIFRSVCDVKPGKFVGINLKAALSSRKQRPTFDSLLDLSVLELCLLASMKRLEAKEYDSYNFIGIYKEYRQLQSSNSTCDLYSKQAALKAFEHLLERELVGYPDGKWHCSLSEISPVKMLVSWEELREGLDASSVCPAFLLQWFAHEAA